MIVSKNRPTPEMVEKAYHTNDHGGGVAWRENGLVKWKKGLVVEEMQHFIKSLPLPFVAHFRIASSGGQSPMLCHPFPVEKQVDVALEGQTKSYVLFHNGHWGEWKSFTKETALRMGSKIPMGVWSDSRAMAWAAHNYGLGILDMIDEKCVAFSPTDLEVIKGSGWDEVDGVWCSNKHWNSSGYQVYNHQKQHGGHGFFGQGGQSKEASHTGVQGGDLAKLPFDQIEVMWKAQQDKPRGEWTLSKKQYKRAKKKHEKKQESVTALALTSIH